MAVGRRAEVLAALTRAAGDIRLERVPDPVPGPGEALLQVECVGLCGTDLHMFLGERADTGFPLLQGHEIAARIVELPAGYEGTLERGARVAVDPSLPCGDCRPCRAGDWPSCVRFEAVGVARPGGLAELVAVPVAQLHDARGLTAELTALAEPFSIAAMALKRAAVDPSAKGRGDQWSARWVLVTGAGPIGLALTVAATDLGLRVLVTDVVAERLQIATGLGAERVVVLDPERVDEQIVSAAVRDWTEGDGVDIAFEASGTDAGARMAQEALARSGHLVVVGLGSHDVVVPVPRLLFDGVSLIGSRAGLLGEGLRIVAAHRDIVGRMISHRFPLEEVAAAFRCAHDQPGQAIKVMVEVSAVEGEGTR